MATSICFLHRAQEEHTWDELNSSWTRVSQPGMQTTFSHDTVWSLNGNLSSLFWQTPAQYWYSRPDRRPKRKGSPHPYKSRPVFAICRSEGTSPHTLRSASSLSFFKGETQAQSGKRPSLWTHRQPTTELRMAHLLSLIPLPWHGPRWPQEHGLAPLSPANAFRSGSLKPGGVQCKLHSRNNEAITQSPWKATTDLLEYLLYLHPIITLGSI